MTVAEIERARADAQRARQRLSDDVAVLRDRTSPATLTRDAKDRLIDTVRQKPALVAGGAVALAALIALPGLRRLLWRNRAAIGQLMTRRFTAHGGRPHTSDGKDFTP